MSLPPGIPVPIGAIERELGRLWEQSGQGKTRASLINLAIYSEKQDSLAVNSDVIRKIAGEHAMRSLIIQADPAAAGSHAEAWINMHCYLRGTHGGEVCSEQISFQLSGEAARSLQSVVFSHLDSDLPLVLWWQSDFRSPVNGKLWRWVDRLLFDSSEWKSPGEQFDLIKRIADLTEARTILCDLNWARSLPLRKTLAGIFDTPATLEELCSIRILQIDYAPGSRITALLLVGWLADRLGWNCSSPGANPIFENARGGTVEVTLRETNGASINALHVESTKGLFTVRRDSESDLYAVTTKGINGASSIPETNTVVRAPKEETSELLLSELARGSRHPLYRRAVQAITDLV